MRKILLGAGFVLMLTSPAQAMVGASEPAPDMAAHVVMVLSRSGAGSGFCSASVLSATVVLTAAHCVSQSAMMRVYGPKAGEAPHLLEIAQVKVHPGYRADAIRLRERSVDLALLKLKAPLPSEFQPIALGEIDEAESGTALELVGYGLAQEGIERSGGMLKRAQVALRAPYSALLLWMEGTTDKETGACTGDSGGPVLHDGAIVGVISWTEGQGKQHCGALTQAIKLAPQMGWIKSVMAGW